MGAYSTLCAFDVERLRSHVAPAVRARLADELDVDLARDCALLDETLALSTRSPAAMMQVIPSVDGACRSATCAGRMRCPMHEAQAGPLDAETFGARTKQSVLACCMPADVVLGRHGTGFGLACLHERAHGRDDPDAFFSRDASFVQLATSLTRRAAAWGWGDGGYGEGVLGWLDADEATALARALDALLAHGGAQPSIDGDDALDEALRAMGRALGDHARRCGDIGLGVLLRRD